MQTDISRVPLLFNKRKSLQNLVTWLFSILIFWCQVGGWKVGVLANLFKRSVAALSNVMFSDPILKDG